VQLAFSKHLAKVELILPREYVILTTLKMGSSASSYISILKDHYEHLVAQSCDISTEESDIGQQSWTCPVHCEEVESESWLHDMANFVSCQIKGEVAWVSIKREPVNSLNLIVWQQLTDTLQRAEGNPRVRALVLISGLMPRPVYSSGYDLQELYVPNTSKDRFKEFWQTSNTFLMKLYTSRLVTVAAIKGACPGAACVLAMCCDYRILNEQGLIGLNEISLNLLVPKFWGRLLGKIVGDHNMEKLLFGAVLLTAKNALAYRLIDAVALSDVELLAIANKWTNSALKLPDNGREATKRLLREDFSNEWNASLSKEVDFLWEWLSLPRTVKTIKSALDRINNAHHQQPLSKM
jgi:3,2-trans-enoyl-CoA isomerase